MKCIKIEKKFSSGRSSVYIIFEDSDCIEDKVEEWCENDRYSYDWEEVEDKTIIENTINKEILRVEEKLKYLTGKNERLTKWLTSINTTKS